MKGFIRKILASAMKKPRVKNFLLNSVALTKSDSKKFANKILQLYRKDVIEDLFKYPSVINNGYLHLERAIEIIKSRNIQPHTIVDIGAAGGETAIIFSSAFPGCRVVCFEPIEETFARLKSNTSNYKNIEIHHTALGASKGTSVINVTSRITSSSLLIPDESQQLMGGDHFAIKKSETISINTLDSFLGTNKIDLIKVDVQGFELEVLKGAQTTLRQTMFIVMEMQNHEIYKGAPKYFDLDTFLRSAGFELFELIPSIRDNQQVKEFDALYINTALK